MKTVKFLLLFVLATSMALGCFAQKSKDAKAFTGTIKYAITYEGEIDAATRSQLPSELVLTIGDGKVRNEQATPMYSVISILDLNNGIRTAMFDGMGMKIAGQGEDTSLLKESEFPEEMIIDVKYVEESKMIAGYKSKKAEITVEDQTMEVFYTDEIITPKKANLNPVFEKINGTIMQFSMNAGGDINMIMTAKEIKKGKPKNHLFQVPDDYEKVTLQEFNSMLGGGE